MNYDQLKLIGTACAPIFAFPTVLGPQFRRTIPGLDHLVNFTPDRWPESSGTISNGNDPAIANPNNV